MWCLLLGARPRRPYVQYAKLRSEVRTVRPISGRAPISHTSQSIFLQRHQPDNAGGRDQVAANAGGRGFDSHRGQNLFFTFHSIRVECEELFCVTNKNS